MKLVFLLTIFLSGFNLWAQSQCDPKKIGLSAFQDLSLDQCQKLKASSQCQELYKKISDDGGDLNSKALRCEVDTDLSRGQRMAVSYISCLKGGVEGGIIAPIHSLGTWIGESAAKLVIAFQENRERLKACDANPELKKKIFQSYNASVPKLLKLEDPQNISSKSCVQIEADLYQAKGLKERAVSQKVDPKNFQKNPNLTADEKEYLEYKFKSKEFAEKNDRGLMEMADTALAEYGVRIECYNLEARMALRCEALFNVASLAAGGVGLGKSALSALSGLKAERFVKSVQQISQEAGSLRGMTESQKISLIRQAHKLDDNGRINAAEQLLGRSLKNEREGILAAHAIGAGRGQRALTAKELRQKAEVLKKAGITDPTERELLMRSGVTGEFDDYLQASKIAQEAESRAHRRMLEIERKMAENRSKLKSGKLSEADAKKAEEELANLEKEASDLRADIIVGDVIAPGIGPVDLNRIERRIGYATRQIEISEANGIKTASLLDQRSRLLKESAEFRAMGKDYSGAAREYNLAAKDVVRGLEEGSFNTFEEKLTALRILENAGSANYSEAYSQLATDLARMPQVKNRVINPITMEMPDAARNPLVMNQQKGSVWEMVRQYRDQSTRLEVQRVRNTDLGGGAWEKTNSKARVEFETLVESRSQLRQKIIERLTKESGSNQSYVVKAIKALELD